MLQQLIATCAPEYIDAATQSCSHLEWVAYAGGLPPLSAADGLKISGAVGACWAIGFLVRLIRNAANEGTTP